METEEQEVQDLTAWRSARSAAAEPVEPAETASDNTPQETSAADTSESPASTAHADETDETEKSGGSGKSAEDRVKQLRQAGRHELADKIQREAWGKADRDRIAALERELSEHRAKKTPEAPKAETKADGPPNINDFDEYEAYVAAQIDWRIAENKRKDQAERRQQEEKQRREAVQQRAVEAIRPHVSARPDYIAVAGAATDAIGMNPQDMLEMIADEPETAAALYWLGSQPAEQERIAKLSDRGKVAALGRIAERIGQASQPTSQQPKSVVPISKVPAKDAGPGPGLSKAPPSEAEENDFGAWRKRKQRG